MAIFHIVSSAPTEDRSVLYTVVGLATTGTTCGSHHCPSRSSDIERLLEILFDPPRGRNRKDTPPWFVFLSLLFSDGCAPLFLAILITARIIFK
ncbi:hypothetical protein BDV25DRAFT_78862 [Aspergillus avenaceus]|uniref:Uncharacterized protein n=1 Tax=Aspergillus avenaceus TaxID=36643 RepID=A0A5N6U191_ASPAV|nr:hypothetical protein BDV25DRAFT_78862 [Aspergillus avenaceus]